MNPFRIFTNKKKTLADIGSNKKSLENHLTFDEDFSIFRVDPFNDPYLCSAWINIAVNILTRNVARADFVLERDGVEVKSGSLYRSEERRVGKECK
ncbi:MAG: hypothetical protein LBH44_04035, partial [Treponema sp.]|nr:hypothetical protein [Treponema sp.]